MMLKQDLFEKCFMKKMTLLSFNLISTVLICSEIPTEKSISILVAQTYLQSRKDNASNTFSWEKNLTLKEKIFGKPANMPVRGYGIQINPSIERYGEMSAVIFKITTTGTPEEFEGKNILESEKCTLKHILINKYIDQLKKDKKSQAEIIGSVILDAYTKSTCRPEYMVKELRSEYGLRSRQEIYKERQSMEFVTIIPYSEFDSLIEEYFLDKKLSATDSIDKTLIDSDSSKTAWLLGGAAVGLIVGGIGGYAIK